MPPKKLKKRTEQYHHSLCNVFALEQILELIEFINKAINEDIRKPTSFQNFSNNVSLREHGIMFQKLLELSILYKLQVDAVKNLNDIINTIIAAEKSGIDKIFSIPSLSDEVIQNLAKNNGNISILLINIYQYLKIFIEIQGSNIQRVITKPMTDNFELNFFYSYLIYKNCLIKAIIAKRI